MKKYPVSSIQYPDTKAHSGFTLVEALVALALLTVALVPAFVLATSTITLASSVRNNLIAASLAQEGVEVVRAIRDANWLDPAKPPFNTNLDGCDSGCTFQYNSTAPEADSVATTLKLDPATGLYGYSGPTDTGFTRQVVITDASPGLKVVVTMGWRERSVDKTFILEDYLYNWLQ